MSQTAEASNQDIPNTTTSHFAPKNIPITSIIELIDNKGLSQTQAAKILGCDRSSISKRLKAADYVPGQLKTFKETRADVFAYHQLEILKHLTSAKLKSSTAYQLTGMLALLYDKERLERGESTENVAHIHSIAKQIRDKERGIPITLGADT